MYLDLFEPAVRACKYVARSRTTPATFHPARGRCDTRRGRRAVTIRTYGYSGHTVGEFHKDLTRGLRCNVQGLCSPVLTHQAWCFLGSSFSFSSKNTEE